MASLIPTGKQLYLGNDGLPLNGGKLFTYLAGTSTPKATYSDAAGTVPNANPIILNARGEALVFWSGSYDVTLTDALGNIIYSVLNVTETNLGYRTSTNGSAVIPSGMTAQRDASPLPGYFRYNVDFNNFEAYYAASWAPILKSFNGVAVGNNGDILIKTVGGVSIFGAGDVGIKTVNGLSIMGVGDLPMKTVNGLSINGAGDLPLRTVNGATINGSTDIPFKTINGVTLSGSTDIPLQTVLVSGVSLKTIGSVTLLGAGDIPIPTSIASNLFLNNNYGGF